MKIQLPTWVKPGVSFYESYEGLRGDLWHVRGIVDGNAVCRHWQRDRSRWHYEVVSPVWFHVRQYNLLPRKGS